MIAKARKKLEELLGLPFEKCEDQFGITGHVMDIAEMILNFKVKKDISYLATY